MRRSARADWEVRVYRRFLQLLAGRLPKSYRYDMVELFTDRLEEVRSERLNRLALLFFALLDCVRHGPAIYRMSAVSAAGCHKKTHRIGRGLDAVAQDVRFALRTLKRRPFFSAIAVATLALGIGATTAMFSVVDGVLLKPLPYEDPGRLVSIWQTMPGWEGMTGPEGKLWNRARLTYPQFRLLVEENTSYADLAIYYSGEWGNATLTGVGDPVELRVGAATVSLLPLLNVRPALGRWFLPGEDASQLGGDGASVVVISHELWQGRFGSSYDVLGRSVTIDARTFTIVGVLPRGFRIHWLTASLAGENDPGRRDLWFPIGAPGWGTGGNGAYSWETIGRLGTEITLDRARLETQGILNGHPDTHGEVHVYKRANEETHQLTSPLVLLFGATALVLVIACGNIATLSVAELHGRRHEMATRSALGAARTKIIRLLLTESLVLAGIGSVLGAALAFCGTEMLVALAPPIPRIEEVGVDLRVLTFAALTGTLAGLAFGTVPAIVSSRRSLVPSMRHAGTVSSRRRRFSSAVVAFEVAMTAVLLVAGGLLTRSLSRLMAVDPGFDTHQLATVEVSLPGTRYHTQAARNEFLRDVLALLESTPGIGTVSGANSLPFPGRTSGQGVRIPGRDPEFVGLPFLYHIAPHYLETLGVPLLAGRPLTDADGPDAPLAVVVNETMARRYWPDESPIGTQFRYAGSREPVTVVGVVGDVKKQVLHGDAEPTFYIPFNQHPRTRVCFVARTEAETHSILPLMRQAVWSVDETLAVTNATTVDGSLAQSTSHERYRMLLMNTFGFLAVLLAATGVFGVTARNVAMRKREMGIKMALGANESGLIGATLGGSLLSILAGGAIGLTGALWSSRFISSFLFGVEPSDPITYLAAATLIVAVCLTASLAPALRITRVSPLDVLREE